MAEAVASPVVARLAGAPRWVLVAIALYVGGLILAGILLHPIKVVGPENDDYVSMADSVLRGHLPRDPFRPLLYPLASAGVGWVVGSCFTGAKIVSALGAGLLLLATFALAERCAGRRAALLATALAASNGWIVTYGMLACTDMLFAGFVAAALVAAMRVWDQPSRRHLAALGAWLAFAWFTRYQAATLLLPALLACCTPRGPGTGWLTRARRCGIVAATAAACLVPHFALTHAVFGSIVHDENWRTVAMKYVHDLVFRNLHDDPTGSVAAVLMRDPWGVASRSLQDLRVYFGSLFVATVQGSESPTVGGVLATAVAVAGVLAHLLRRGSILWLPVAHLLAAAAMLCVLWLPLPRFVLANVPIVCLGTAGVVCRLPGGRLGGIRGAAACALLGFAGWHAAVEFEQLRQRHPWAEVETAQRLHDERAVPFRLLTPYIYLTTHLLPDRCAWTWPPYVGEDLSAWGVRLVARAEEVGAAFALFGRLSCGEPAFRALGEWSHPRVRVRERTDEVLLLEIVGIELDWVARTSASPLPMDGGTLDIEVVLRDEVAPRDVAAVGVCFRGPRGERVLLPLQPAVARVYRASVPVPAVPRAPSGAPGWSLEPIVWSTSGRLGGGQQLMLAPR